MNQIRLTWFRLTVPDDDVTTVLLTAVYSARATAEP